MKLGQTLMCCMANISGDWKLFPSPFTILLKCKIWPFLIDTFAILHLPYSPFQKKNHWNLDIIGY